MLVPDGTLVRVLVDHIAAFGGVPFVAVFDRPQDGAPVGPRHGVVTEWNPTSAGFVMSSVYVTCCRLWLTALRLAFECSLIAQAIGAEYIAHDLGDATPGVPFDPDADRPPPTAAPHLPRAGRARTRPSRSVRSRGVGGRS